MELDHKVTKKQSENNTTEMYYVSEAERAVTAAKLKRLNLIIT